MRRAPARIVVDLAMGTGALARVAIVANHSSHHMPHAGTERLQIAGPVRAARRRVSAFAASRLNHFRSGTHRIPLLHNAAILLEPDSVQRPLDL